MITLLRTLIILLSLSLFLLFYGKIFEYKPIHFWVIQSILCFLYLIALFVEVRESSKVNDIPLKRFSYLPHSVWFFALLRALIFVVYGFFLLFSGGRMIYLIPLVWMVGLGEWMIFLFRKWSGQYYLTFYANYVDFHSGRKHAVFSRDIVKIEKAGEVVYFFLKNKKILEIRLFLFTENNREAFQDHLKDWCKKNNISYPEK